MLTHSRCLQFAMQYLPALRQLPTPDVPTLERLGADALNCLECDLQSSDSCDASSQPGERSSLALRIRACIEAVIAPHWAGATVHLFGSSALGLAGPSSDVDICALLPSVPQAHCRDANGRAKVRAILPEATRLLRACAGVKGLQMVPSGRTPLLRFEFEDAQLCLSVELCFNNTDGLANTHVMSELLQASVAGAHAPLRAIACVVRRWARRRRLAGLHSTLNSYSWTLLAAFSMQCVGELPVVRASSEAFAALLLPPGDVTPTYASVDGAWRALARASLCDHHGGEGADVMSGLRAASIAGVCPTAP